MAEPMYIRKTETESIMGDKIILYYFTYETEKPCKKGRNLSFGIGIDMYTQLPNERTVRERKIAEGIFASKREAEAFIDRLCNGFVTPSTLDDIIEDNIIA